MTVSIDNGWLSGSLEDDTGRAWPIRLFRQNSARGPLEAAIPNLILHTTETDGYVESLRFPSQWQCGEGIIGQHIKLGLAGDAVNNWDTFAQQIEMVGRSNTGLWLPRESTLGPTVALVAWLHRSSLIKSGLIRPKDWPDVLDRLPAAVESYYRRHAGAWPQQAGVYGHVDIPDNSHWDPGSFNYPVFFRRVRDAIAVQEDDMTDAERERLQFAWENAKKAIALENAINDFIDGTPPPADASVTRRRAFRALNEAASRPEPGAHLHPELAPVDHPHTATTSVE